MLTFRGMEEGDLPEVCRIERETFKDPWSHDALAFELRDNMFCLSFVAEKDGRLAGYAFLHLVDDNSHLVNIAIDGSLRGKGFGAMLLKHVVETAAARGASVMGLEVRAGNAAAIGLYDKFGFKRIRRQKGYYGDGEDAVIMVLAMEAAGGQAQE